jgi:hypothetical protein
MASQAVPCDEVLSHKTPLPARRKTRPDEMRDMETLKTVWKF